VGCLEKHTVTKSQKHRACDLNIIKYFLSRQLDRNKSLDHQLKMEDKKIDVSRDTRKNKLSTRLTTHPTEQNSNMSNSYPRYEEVKLPYSMKGYGKYVKITYLAETHGLLSNSAEFEHVTEKRKHGKKSKEYSSLIIRTKQGVITFKINRKYFKKIAGYKWHMTNGYLSTYCNKENNAVVVYLHEMIMMLKQGWDSISFEKALSNLNRLKKSIDHINRIKEDNTEENLRFATQSQQTINQGMRVRNTSLPEKCGFTHSNIPRMVQFSQSATDRKYKVIVELHRLDKKRTTLLGAKITKGRCLLNARSGGTGDYKISPKLTLAHGISLLCRAADRCKEIDHPDIGSNRNFNHVRGIENYNDFINSLTLLNKHDRKSCLKIRDPCYVPLPLTKRERYGLLQLIAAEKLNVKKVFMNFDVVTNWEYLGIAPIPGILM
jgi:hypothetical protein